MKKIKNLNRGFGLIEVLIATVLLGVLGVGTATLVENMSKGSKTATQNQEAITLVNSAKQVVNDAQSCQSSFATTAMPADGTEIDLPNISIMTSTGPVPVVEKAPKNYSGMEVTEIKLKNVGQIGPSWVTAGVTYSKHYVTLTLKMKKSSGSYAPDSTRSFNAFMVQNHATSFISECLGAEGTEQAACEAAGGEFSDVTDPKCQWPRMAFSTDTAAFRNFGLYPANATGKGEGIYTKDGLKSDGNISAGAATLTASNGNISTTGSVSAASMTATGAMTAGSMTAGTITSTGAISAGAGISAVGDINSSGTLVGTRLNIGGNATIGGNVALTTGSLTVSAGTITASGNITSTSDQRLKTNIHTIDDALEKVLQLRGVRFDWKNQPNASHSQVGVIAQEMEKVFPEVVVTSPEGTKSVAYGNLVGVLIEAIKAQQKQIDELKAEVNLKKSR